MKDFRATKAILDDKNTLSAILAGGVRPADDLNPHDPADPTSDSDSFYVLSYLEGDGHKFTVLFHLIVLNKPQPPAPGALLGICVLDETVNPPTFFSKEFPDVGLLRTSVSKDELNIQVFSSPNRQILLGHLSGTPDKLLVEGRVLDGIGTAEIEIALTLNAVGPTLPDLASGVIPFPGGLNYEYAFPRMSAAGTLKLEGVTYKVSGNSWLDREWGRYGSLKWTWMGIALNNDVLISLWDQQDFQANPQTYVGGKAFATILDANDNITTTTVTIKENTFAASQDGSRMYPDSWTVTIPGKGALQVQTLKGGQDIISMIPRLEAKSKASGIYEGKSVEGTAFVEAGVIPPPSGVTAISPSPTAASPRPAIPSITAPRV